MVAMTDTERAKQLKGFDIKCHLNKILKCILQLEEPTIKDRWLLFYRVQLREAYDVAKSISETVKAEQEETILNFVNRRGMFWLLGGPVSTYPEGDERNIGIYNTCLRLEKKGLVKRKTDEPGHVCWEVVER